MLGSEQQQLFFPELMCYKLLIHDSGVLNNITRNYVFLTVNLVACNLLRSTFASIWNEVF